MFIFFNNNAIKVVVSLCDKVTTNVTIRDYTNLEVCLVDFNAKIGQYL